MASEHGAHASQASTNRGRLRHPQTAFIPPDAVEAEHSMRALHRDRALNLHALSDEELNVNRYHQAHPHVPAVAEVAEVVVISAT